MNESEDPSSSILPRLAICFGPLFREVTVLRLLVILYGILLYEKSGYLCLNAPKKNKNKMPSRHHRRADQLIHPLKYPSSLNKSSVFVRLNVNPLAASVADFLLESKPRLGRPAWCSERGEMSEAEWKVLLSLWIGLLGPGGCGKAKASTSAVLWALVLVSSVLRRSAMSFMVFVFSSIRSCAGACPSAPGE